VFVNEILKGDMALAAVVDPTLERSEHNLYGRETMASTLAR
jgi:hypothetical protein